MDQIVLLDRVEIWIGKKSKTVASLLHEIARYLRFVNADRNRSEASVIERLQIFLNTPQLGVARWSPVAAIEDK